MTDTPLPESQVPDWKRHLTGLPSQWPCSVAEQAADPVVRAAIRRAYEARASMSGIRAVTGRSHALIRRILIEEKVLRPRGRSQRCSAVLEGHASWLEAVTGVLRGRIEDGTYPVGTALPSMKTLAADLSALRWSVQEAVHRLAGQGLVLPVPSYGTVVTDPRHVPDLVATVRVGSRTTYWPLPGTRARRADQLRRTLLHGLADGTYAPGPLPEVADLARQAAVPRYELARVLAPLEQRGVLVWRQRELCVPDSARDRAADLLAATEGGEERAA
ncbi:GntR family transcriptional regulator [Streptomyces sp. 4F14]|uniref:GntR family transcriptional regulator n=1 Tax=Streptomyces sp. 4F14 TaxID=3394380 RepID=UPI003A86D827